MCTQSSEKFAAGLNISRDVREKHFKNVISMLNDNNIEYFVGYGSLLGIIREGRLLEFDDDIDILVSEKDYNKAYELVSKKYALLRLDHDFCTGNPLEGKIELYKYIKKDNKVIDTWSLKHGTPSTYDIDIVFPIKRIYVSSVGIQINVPKSPENFLGSVYSNWRVPTREKGYKK